MTFTRLLLIVAMVGLAIWGIKVLRDPYAARLPVGSTDLTSIRSALDRLPSDERALVEAYVARSDGNVLPPTMATPDMPFTARNVREAIKLQRELAAAEAKEDQRQQENWATAEARDEARRDTMRQAVSLELLKREIWTAQEHAARQAQAYGRGGAKRGVPNKPVMVITFRLVNLSSHQVAGVHGSVTVRSRDGDSAIAAAQCGIDRDVELDVGGSVDVQCLRVEAPSPQDQALIDSADSALEVEWRPSLVRFSDGTQLR